MSEILDLSEMEGFEDYEEGDEIEEDKKEPKDKVLDISEMEGFEDYDDSKRNIPEEEKISKLESAAIGFAQELMFDWGDEALAKIKSSLKGTKYEDELEEIREHINKAATQNPGSYFGGALTAGGASMLVPGLGAAKVARLGSKLVPKAGKLVDKIDKAYEGMSSADKLGAGMVSRAVGGGTEAAARTVGQARTMEDLDRENLGRNIGLGAAASSTVGTLLGSGYKKLNQLAAKSKEEANKVLEKVSKLDDLQKEADTFKEKIAKLNVDKTENRLGFKEKELNLREDMSKAQDKTKRAALASELNDLKFSQRRKDLALEKEKLDLSKKVKELEEPIKKLSTKETEDLASKSVLTNVLAYELAQKLPGGAVSQFLLQKHGIAPLIGKYGNKGASAIIDLVASDNKLAKRFANSLEEGQLGAVGFHQYMMHTNPEYLSNYKASLKGEDKE